MREEVEGFWRNPIRMIERRKRMTTCEEPIEGLRNTTLEGFDSPTA